MTTKNNENELIESDLDISWIEETERFQNLSENPTKEPASSISMCCLYINQDSTVDSFTHDRFVFRDICSNMITSDELLEISQTYKKKTNTTKYVMKNIVLFHLGFDAEQVIAFSQSSPEELQKYTKSCMHTYHSIESIEVPPSLFVFHDFNTLYFIFHEEASAESKQNLKSILKSDKSKPYSERHKFTKRVRIEMPRNTRKSRA